MYGRPFSSSKPRRAPVQRLGCTVDEQARWLAEAWEGAHEAQRDGADVRAVTLWSAFGADDWDSLVTQRRDRCEPGAFDVCDGVPEATERATRAPEAFASATAPTP